MDLLETDSLIEYKYYSYDTKAESNEAYTHCAAVDSCKLIVENDIKIVNANANANAISRLVCARTL